MDKGFLKTDGIFLGDNPAPGKLEKPYLLNDVELVQGARTGEEFGTTKALKKPDKNEDKSIAKNKGISDLSVSPLKKDCTSKRGNHSWTRIHSKSSRVGSGVKLVDAELNRKNSGEFQTADQEKKIKFEEETSKLSALLATHLGLAAVAKQFCWEQ